jgi:hypothetical protein
MWPLNHKITSSLAPSIFYVKKTAIKRFECSLLFSSKNKIMKKNLKTWIWIDRKTDIGKSEPDNQFPFFEETMNLENSHILQLK